MKATIYIRKENEKWWQENGSSAWVNDAIRGLTLSAPEEKMYAGALEPKKSNLCEHLQPPGKCKYPGCKNARGS